MQSDYEKVVKTLAVLYIYCFCIWGEVIGVTYLVFHMCTHKIANDAKIWRGLGNIAAMSCLHKHLVHILSQNYVVED